MLMFMFSMMMIMIIIMFIGQNQWIFSSSTYSSCNSMPLSSRADVELLPCPATLCVVDNLSAGKPNSRSACSGNGVGVSKTSVSTIEPFDEPNETLQQRKIARNREKKTTNMLRKRNV